MNYWSIGGLILDIFGVILLVIDLIIYQLSIRRMAKEGRTTLDELESEYGGIESWTNDIVENCNWIPEDFYARTHVEDELSYNARHTLGTLKDVSSAVSGLAARLAEVTKILYVNAGQDERKASRSIRISIVGLCFLVLGFSLQVVGALIVR